ncbi:hypothetical protein BJV77DRAFT_32081 [Russula vinacea]|nr:hypothetical protein BJV77DRAFT_32081 [Russula vinacea]
MMFPTFALLSGIALFASGAAAVTTYQISVSNDSAALLFDPSYITAEVGDIVEFTFHPKNHSVTQSSFPAPCTPLEGGFDTGFNPVANGTSDSALPTRQFTVNDTNPIWIHCRQAANTAASHCGKGMVFAVNPGADGSNNSFANFKAEALAIGAQLAANATTSTSAAASGTGTASSSTATKDSGATTNGGISLDVNGATLMTVFGMVVGLMTAA